MASFTDDDELRIGALEGAAMVRERRTTQELVFEFLRDAILSGRLRDGSHLIQDRIANELNVSRVPVREALLQLESEGLVRMEAHRGASVVWLSPEEIAEVFEIRAILVSAAIRRVVPHLTDDQIARLRDVAERQAKEPSPPARARLVHTFYATLFEGLQRPRLRALMDKLECEVRRYLLALPNRHFIGYGDVVEALAQRDAELAAERMTRHLEQVCEEAVRRLRQLLAEDGQVAASTTTRGSRRRKAAG